MSCPSIPELVIDHAQRSPCFLEVLNLSAATDEEITRKWQCAESTMAANQVFEEIYRRYQSRVAMWCGRLIRDPGRGVDLAQEVFLKAHRYRHTFRGDSRLSTWLYAIARNQCLNATRKLEIDPLARLGEFPPDLADGAGKLHSNLEIEEAFEQLWIIFEKTLTAMEKRVMALHYGHDVTLDVITRSYGLDNASGAKAYIVSAKRKLKRYLHERRSAPDQACAA